MKVYIKAVGNTVFFKQFDADFEVEGSVSFRFEGFDVIVGVQDIWLDSQTTRISSSKRGCRGTSINMQTDKQAQDYAEKLKRICAEVVKRYRDREEVKNSEDGIYVF